MIQPESDEEEPEDEEKDEAAEEPVPEESIEASKETSQAVGLKKQSTAKAIDPKAVAPTPQPEESVIADPNAAKFIPGCIHFDRTQF